MKKILTLLLATLALLACSDTSNRARAVYVLVDTSGTYVKELDKAQAVLNYLLIDLNAGDSLAIGRIKSRSFSEKDIVAKVTFERDPLQINTQKKIFKEQSAKLAELSKTGSMYTDITGGILQAVEFLNETGAGHKTIVVISDLQEELDKQVVRDVPLKLNGIRVVALNVTKLGTDNVDPRRYSGRLEWWEKRVKDAGAVDWRVANDLDHLERIFKK